MSFFSYFYWSCLSFGRYYFSVDPFFMAWQNFYAKEKTLLDNSKIYEKYQGIWC